MNTHSVRIVSILTIFLIVQGVSAQPDRIDFNEQSLFLSGANLAWVNFARDIGPGQTEFDRFAATMLDVHNHGGNTLRWWLHCDGSLTPEFGTQSMVEGPGLNAVEDLKQILDLAWEHEIGLILCLWSFDMLRKSNPESVQQRNSLLLSDPAYLNAYIQNALLPLVQAVKNHPAIIAWEIFNEAEGMSNEFGWDFTTHVPMSDIQRFINLCAAAIHRTDPTAQVTCGAWSFISLSAGNLMKKPDISAFSTTEIRVLEELFYRKYKIQYTAQQITDHIQHTALNGKLNYYSDHQLRAAGGDTIGVLDFYSVHYYPWAGEYLSPFHWRADVWNLDKPIVVAEFPMDHLFPVFKPGLFEKLYGLNYAGALPWSWNDTSFSTREEMRSAMKVMQQIDRDAVDIQGISGDWPIVTLLKPQNGQLFSEETNVILEAAAVDPDGTIARVEFFLNDTQKIGEIGTSPYILTLNEPDPGRYTIRACATDNNGNQRLSETVQISVLESTPDLRLYQNYPNPFNPQTVFRYSLPEQSRVILIVYDVTGRLISTLIDAEQPRGAYNVSFDTSDLPSGIYFYRLQAVGTTLVRKMVKLN